MMRQSSGIYICDSVVKIDNVKAVIGQLIVREWVLRGRRKSIRVMCGERNGLLRPEE